MTYGEIVKAAKRGVQWACSLCAAPAVDAAHIDARGMGGSARPKADDPAWPACRQCHGDSEHSRGELKTRESNDGALVFSATGATAERLGVPANLWRVAKYHGKTLDEIGEAP